MKQLSLLILSFIVLASCQPKEDYKAARTEVVDIHDKVMVSTEIAIHKKMELDTLAGRMDSLQKMNVVSDTLTELKQINSLRGKLTDLDNQMTDWMHGFKPELDERTNEEAIKYFKAEKVKILALDSVYHQVLKETNAYLTKYHN